MHHQLQRVRFESDTVTALPNHQLNSKSFTTSLLINAPFITYFDKLSTSSIGIHYTLHLNNNNNKTATSTASITSTDFE